jgi:hypothetical protein
MEVNVMSPIDHRIAERSEPDAAPIREILAQLLAERGLLADDLPEKVSPAPAFAGSEVLVLSAA